MKNLNTYILEKLHITKNIYLNNYINNMLEMLSIEDNEKDIVDIFEKWIGDYNKKLYFYCTDIDYKYKWKKYFKKYDNIWISIVPLEKILEVKEKLKMECVFSHDNYSEEKYKEILEIYKSETSMLIKLSRWNSILFDKIKS